MEPLPLSDFQKKKFARLFEVLDVDRDGFVKEEDFTRRAHRFAAIRGWPSDSEQFREHLSFTYQDWQSLRRFADSNRDHRVSHSEFITFTEDFLSDVQAVEAYAYTDALLLFKAMDVDDDGRIGVEEYRSYLRMYDLDASSADEFFRRADLDRDGHITLWELVEAMRDFLLSSDPEAAGNYLYGPLG